jgi:acetamidase/formamidase
VGRGKMHPTNIKLQCTVCGKGGKTPTLPIQPNKQIKSPNSEKNGIGNELAETTMQCMTKCMSQVIGFINNPREYTINILYQQTSYQIIDSNVEG